MAQMEKNTLSDTLKDLTPIQQRELIPYRPVYVAYRGSHAHGTHVTPTNGGIDDIDVVAAYIPGIENYLGLPRTTSGLNKFIGHWDCAAYELRHFVSMLMNCNPDVMQSLWVEPEHHILVTPEGAELLRNRKLFATKRAYDSFGGYARGQLKRMTAFHESGEATCCDGEEFHEADCSLTKERGRGSRKKFATGFMGAKRKALVKQFGYDTKNAAHLIRLLRMGREFLETGELEVYRKRDYDQLIGIKRGGLTLPMVNEMATEEFARLDEAYKNSSLPEEPDRKEIEKLLVQILSYATHEEVVLQSYAMVDRYYFDAMKSDQTQPTLP